MTWDLLLLIAAAVGWFVINRWIFPKLGIPS